MANTKSGDKKRCIVCNKLRSPSYFYKSYSDFHADGLLPICIDCVLEKSLNDERTDIELSRFQKVLQQCNKPYIEKLFRSSVSQVEYKYPNKQGAAKAKTTIGLYVKNLNGLYQYQELTWEDSEFEDSTEETEDTEYIVVSNDGYKYTIPQYNAMVALFEYLLSEYGYKKGSKEYALLNAYAALRIRAEEAAIKRDVDTHFQYLGDCGDILTFLNWED